jgi:hypothetical protein
MKRKAPERPYVVNASVVAGEGRQSHALTRDAIRLEVAMRLVAKGTSPQHSWDTADEFACEMDKHLPELKELPAEESTNGRNRSSTRETV